MICKEADIPLCRWCEYSSNIYCALESFENKIRFRGFVLIDTKAISAKDAKTLFTRWLQNLAPVYQEKICMRKAVELHLPEHLELFDKLLLMS